MEETRLISADFLSLSYRYQHTYHKNKRGITRRDFSRFYDKKHLAVSRLSFHVNAMLKITEPLHP